MQDCGFVDIVVGDGGGDVLSNFYVYPNSAYYKTVFRNSQCYMNFLPS